MKRKDIQYKKKICPYKETTSQKEEKDEKKAKQSIAKKEKEQTITPISIKEESNNKDKKINPSNKSYVGFFESTNAQQTADRKQQKYQKKESDKKVYFLSGKKIKETGLTTSIHLNSK